LEQVIRALKNELDVNVEPAGPADFLPIPASVLDRSRFVGRYGQVSVFHYHVPSLVISKAARGFEQDLEDAVSVIRAGDVSWEEIDEQWQGVRASPTGLIRYDPEEVEQRLSIVRERSKEPRA
jgi:hypothetical protein